MANITLVQRKNTYTPDGTFIDTALETGGISINADAYGAALDRVYDVKGLSSFYLRVKNTHGSNGLTYKVQKARATKAITALVDGDFVDGIVVEGNVAAGAEDENTIAITQEYTFFRLRVKRQTSSNDATMEGNAVGK